MIKLLYSVRLVLSWLAIKHMWSSSVVCSCLVFYNPIGSLKRAGQLVLCQSRLSGMDKPGWRESARQRYIIALVQFAAKASSSRYAYIHWQTSHSNMLTFMRHTHAYTHIYLLSDSDCHQSEEIWWQTTVIQAPVSRVSNGISSFPVKPFRCFVPRVTLSYTVVLFVSVWFTGDPRQSWPVCLTRCVSWSHAWQRWGE